MSNIECSFRCVLIVSAQIHVQRNIKIKKINCYFKSSLVFDCFQVFELLVNCNQVFLVHDKQLQAILA